MKGRRMLLLLAVVLALGVLNLEQANWGNNGSAGLDSYGIATWHRVFLVPSMKAKNTYYKETIGLITKKKKENDPDWM